MLLMISRTLFLVLLIFSGSSLANCIEPLIYGGDENIVAREKLSKITNGSFAKLSKERQFEAAWCLSFSNFHLAKPYQDTLALAKNAAYTRDEISLIDGLGIYIELMSMQAQMNSVYSANADEKKQAIGRLLSLLNRVTTSGDKFFEDTQDSKDRRLMAMRVLLANGLAGIFLGIKDIERGGFKDEVQF